MGKEIKSTGKDLESLGGSLTKSITVPLAATGGFAAKAAIDFEDAFAGVRKTVDATEKEFAEIRQGIRDMSKEIPVASTEIAGVAEAAGQLGIEIPNILGFTRVMTDLGVATNMTSEDAAMALARLANITQMPQTEFDKLGSVIVDLGNNLASTESEIVEMGLRLAGAGKQVGMTEAQTLSFAAALSSVGVEAQAGGSAFSKVMVQMQLASETGGKSLKNFANVAGMSSSDFQKAFKEDAAGAIIEFIKGLSTAEERGLSAIKMLDDMGIKEVRLRDSLLRAAGAGNLFNEAVEIGTNAWEENVALTNEAAERYKTTKSQLQLLKNKVMDVAITLGDALLPYILKTIDTAQPFIDFIDKLAKKFDSLPESTQQAIIRFALLAAAAGPTIFVFGKMTTGIGNLIRSYGKFAKAVKKVGLIKTIFSPGNLVVLTLLALAAACVLVYKNWDKIKDVVAKVKTRFDDVRNTVITLKTNLIDLKDNAIETVRKKLDDFKTVLEDNQGAIKATATILGVIFGPALIKTGIQAAIAGGKIAANFIANVVKTGVQAAINGVKLTATFVASLIKAGAQAVIAGGRIAVSFIASLIRSGAQAIITAGIIAGQLVVSLARYAAQGWITIASIVATIAAWVAQRAVMIGSAVATQAMTAAQWALNVAMSANPIALVIILVAGLAAGLVVLYQKSETARNIMNNLWNSIKTGATTAVNIAIGAINRLISGLNRIKIPSWVPGIGGKGVNIPLVPKLAKGTDFWKGGIVQVHEKGGEVIDLPRGSRVYPHDESVQMARTQGRKEGSKHFNLEKLADTLVIREEADIKKIAVALVKELNKAEVVYGGA